MRTGDQCAGCGDAGTGFSRAAGRPMHEAMDSSAYAFTHGVRHTRATLRAWQQHPGRVLGRWVAGSALAAAGLLTAVWVIASLEQWLRADRRAAPPVRGRQPRRRCRRARAQHARARAARDGLRRGLHRGQLAADAGRAAHSGISRWVHEHGGRLAIGFVVARDDLLAECAGLSDRTHARRRSGLPARLARAAAARRAAARDPRADRAVPAAGRLDHRQPARRVGAAARGHRSSPSRFAVPMLVVAAFIEVYVSPHLFTALTHIHPADRARLRRLGRDGALARNRARRPSLYFV